MGSLRRLVSFGPSFSFFAFAALSVASLGVAGCQADTSSPQTSSDDLTSIQRTAAKQQSIANCWLYATASWTESLHLRVSKEQLDVSEAYWSYFHWFDQATDRVITDYSYPGALFPTGWWGTGAELMRQRGWMNETDFLPQDNGETYSARQKQALEIFQASLYSGPLANPAARADRALVISELNRAWGILPEVAEKLAQAFGPNYERTLLSPDVALEGTGVHTASEVTIGSAKDSGGNSRVLTMADAIGEPAGGEASIGGGARVGPYAWSQVVAGSTFRNASRELEIRAQKALNQNLPVWITWWADDIKIAENGTYHVDVNAVGGNPYLHASLIVDYQVDVPGFGLLPAGTPETRPDALAASLAPEAVVQFFRIKNPWWGSYDLEGYRTPFAEGPGYHDVDLAYLREVSPQGDAMLHSLILPNDPALVIGIDAN